MSFRLHNYFLTRSYYFSAGLSLTGVGHLFLGDILCLRGASLLLLGENHPLSGVILLLLGESLSLRGATHPLSGVSRQLLGKRPFLA